MKDDDNYVKLPETSSGIQITTQTSLLSRQDLLPCTSKEFYSM